MLAKKLLPLNDLSNKDSFSLPSLNIVINRYEKGKETKDSNPYQDDKENCMP